MADGGLQQQYRTVAYIHSLELLKVSGLNPGVTERSTIVHSLIESLGLLNQAHVRITAPNSSSACNDEALSMFHSNDYIQFLKSRESGLYDDDEMDEEYGMDCDCPPFKGLFSYVCCISEASLEAAKVISNGDCQLAINWYGGRHHGNRDKASGFCYCNDVVICILHLLKYFPRVLYIDIDIHHGDGVEQAFHYSNRVVTLSLHKYGPGYFPGTGSIDSIGSGNGLYHTINVPLEEGVTDEQYTYIFKSIADELIPRFKPGVIVLLCGADCLVNDPLGGFNLTQSGVGQCVETVLELQLPTIVLGGVRILGGYNLPNTARLWAYLTSIITKIPLPNHDIPEHKYFTLYGPDYQLTIEPGTRPNMNTDASINQLLQTVLGNIHHM